MKKLLGGKNRVDAEERKLMGARIKAKREERGYSQDRLAEALGMKRTNIANYEAGRVTPPGSVLKELAEILNTSTDYLLLLSDDDGTDAHEGPPKMDERFRALARNWQDMDSEDQGLLINLSQSMSKRGREAKKKSDS